MVLLKAIQTGFSIESPANTESSKDPKMGLPGPCVLLQKEGEKGGVKLVDIIFRRRVRIAGITAFPVCRFRH